MQQKINDFNSKKLIKKLLELETTDNCPNTLFN